MDVIIVCHTEFGFVHKGMNIFDKNATAGVVDGVNNLVTVANKYGAKITFAVMPEVAMYFPKDIRHEVGLHIHPGWQESQSQGFKFYVGDSYLRKHCRQSTNSLYLIDYPYNEQLEMIKIGKDYLAEVLGIEPKTFVAGMWSINNDTVKALTELGISHDCSIPPHLESHHYNYSQLPRICMPYHPSEEDYQRSGSSPLLIVPIAQMILGGNMNPEVVPIVGLPWLRACFREYYRQGLPLFHICLHSPCMVDPYFIAAMDALLEFISKHKNINFRFASEIREYYNNIWAKTDLLPYLLGINGRLVRTFLKSRILWGKLHNI